VSTVLYRTLARTGKETVFKATKLSKANFFLDKRGISVTFTNIEKEFRLSMSFNFQDFHKHTRTQGWDENLKKLSLTLILYG
jgi:lipoprotein NlpI